MILLEQNLEKSQQAILKVKQLTSQVSTIEQSLEAIPNMSYHLEELNQ